MNLQYYKLNFTTPLHIGSNKPGFESSEEIIHSDTLFSAIINTWNKLYPQDMELFFNSQAGDEFVFPYFRLSSAFPYLESLLFFPRPLYRLNLPEDYEKEKPDLLKSLKDVKYISKDIFEKILNGKILNIDENNITEDGKFLLEPNQIEDTILFKKHDVPRILKDRFSNETTPFYFTRTHYNINSGLFFIAEFKSQEWQDKFEAILRLLGDTGIGGDRSVGHGLFEVKGPQNLDLDLDKTSNHFITLSLYHPNEKELESILKSASYQLMERKGWVFAKRSKPLRRQTVRMFTESSIFNGSPDNYGNTVRVLKAMPQQGLDNDVYRYGQTINLPIRLRGGANG
ncbi:MAG: type III-A CRISPR-associated RAMP protein Csm4 [Candidatus Marinimicrobia bacterium]|nr:type III-A CRISPR-associated RAMP protein Csm4 [Candidatus Neomarinimicrobiota bacterium]